jgi:electron transport complex protein RnfB
MSTHASGPRQVASIDEARCIGCTLCIEACPFDAILGAARQMHTVLTALCTGCALCVAPCPVDCIAMLPATGADAVWDRTRALAARQRAKARILRLARDAARHAALPAPQEADMDARAERDKRAAIETALQRARSRRAAAKGASDNGHGRQS